MAEKPRSLAPYSCSLCTEEVFSPNEQKLFGHAVETHPLNAPSSRDATAWKDFAEEASTKAMSRSTRLAIESPSDSDDQGIHTPDSNQQSDDSDDEIIYTPDSSQRSDDSDDEVIRTLDPSSREAQAHLGGPYTTNNSSNFGRAAPSSRCLIDPDPTSGAQRSGPGPLSSPAKRDTGNYRNNIDQHANEDEKPELLLQPETRPISHEQLVVEVKGIYAGLAIIEAKCIDVDEKQSIAAQERDPSKQTTLTSEQWQALIALHKTLLHEHYDFFLASQHPSASLALSRLAAKYSMPARMWRHGVYAFLEVLRHRLPASLEHMLAFINIAYSIMALLYETVPTFEDTWIECLADLGRYRMAISDDIRDRDTWSGIARFWYGKAANKSPNVGRLYHHSAILARPHTIQQLSLYTHSLTCIMPFESARGSLVNFFNSIESKQDPIRHKFSSTFVKAHGLLFTGGSIHDFRQYVDILLDGMLQRYIGRAGPRFKEVGVSAMMVNAAALFEYGVIKSKDSSNNSSKSILCLAFEEARSFDPKSEFYKPMDNATESRLFVEGLSEEEFKIYSKKIKLAATLVFGTLSTALRKPEDNNVYPMIHAYLVLIRGLAGAQKAMLYLERWIPWEDLAFFLTSIATQDTMTSRVFAEAFPIPQTGIGRPLPEDFIMRGQPWSEFYFPPTWFLDAAVADEERTIELLSMKAPRIERILWLGVFLTTGYRRWLSYDEETRKFSTTQIVKDFPTHEFEYSTMSLRIKIAL